MRGGGGSDLFCCPNGEGGGWKYIILGAGREIIYFGAYGG